MENKLMRWTVALAIIVIVLSLACWRFPQMREMLPDWSVDR